MIRLIVPELTPSLNKVLNMHFRSRMRLKERWAVLLVLAGAKRAAPATGRRRLTVERHSPRGLDYDNLVGGAKSVVVDNCRDFGLLIDDKPTHAELVYLHVKTAVGERPWTLIVIEDLPVVA